ncbi:hypothetical protein N9W11_04490 [Psychrosphaera haliotis]|uniref:hypothetical protein n=1 Tax=Psychrosphaera haliotis TaxID=555083 RepID=UPI00236B8352|nr:hypothetical protein [Psychrosphaera haliotis]
MFSKEFVFNVKGKEVRICNNWIRGIKLYVDGDFKDEDKRLFAFSGKTLLSANLGEGVILEVVPVSATFTVEMDAYLREGQTRTLAYSSYQRLSLKEQRASGDAA